MSDIVQGSIDHLIGSDSHHEAAGDNATAVLLVMLTAIVLLVCAVVVFGYAAIIVYALSATAAAIGTLVILTAGR